MRVLVDTSVWVDFFNGHASPEAEALTRLLEEDGDLLTCGVIVTEVLQGLRRNKVLATIEEQFREMAWLSPVEPTTYLAAANLFRALRQKGITIRSTIDCLIACLAAEHNAVLLAKDRDLRSIVDSKTLALVAFPLLAQ